MPIFVNPNILGTNLKELSTQNDLFLKKFKVKRLDIDSDYIDQKSSRFYKWHHGEKQIFDKDIYNQKAIDEDVFHLIKTTADLNKYDEHNLLEEKQRVKTEESSGKTRK